MPPGLAETLGFPSRSGRAVRASLDPPVGSAILGGMTHELYQTGDVARVLFPQETP